MLRASGCIDARVGQSRPSTRRGASVPPDPTPLERQRPDSGSARVQFLHGHAFCIASTARTRKSHALGPRFDIRDNDLDSLPDSPHLAGSIPAAGLPLEMARLPCMPVALNLLCKVFHPRLQPMRSGRSAPQGQQLR
jgi:hypothetical protein